MSPDEVIPKFIDQAGKAQVTEKHLRRIYSELIVLWQDTPVEDTIFDEVVWEQAQLLIDELINVTSVQNYSKYRVRVQQNGFGEAYVGKTEYRNKLGRLIEALRQEYWPHETSQLNRHADVPHQAGISITNNNHNDQQQSQVQSQHQNVELEQLVHNAVAMIQADYDDDKAEEARELIKQIILNPQNWGVIANAVTGLLAVGKIAFIAALPILQKILQLQPNPTSAL